MARNRILVVEDDEAISKVIGQGRSGFQNTGPSQRGGGLYSETLRGAGAARARGEGAGAHGTAPCSPSTPSTAA